MSQESHITTLTDAQADGLACVHCGRDYLRSPGVSHVPVERDGEYVRGPSGSQLFVCANTCEYDVKGTRPASTPGVHTVDTLARDHVADAGKMLGGDHVRDVPEKVVSDADIPAPGQAYKAGYTDGVARGRRYPAPDRPGPPDVSDEVEALRAMYGPPNVDEVAKVAAWANLGVTELLELRDGQPLDRDEIRQVVRWVDELTLNMNALLNHLGVKSVAEKQSERDRAKRAGGQ